MDNNPAFILGRLAACYNRIIGTPEYNIQQSTAAAILRHSPKQIAEEMKSNIQTATIQPELKPLLDDVVNRIGTLPELPVLAWEIGIFLDGYRREKIILDAIPKSATKKIKFR